MSNPYRDRNEYNEYFKKQQDAGFDHSMHGTDSSDPGTQAWKEHYDQMMWGKTPASSGSSAPEHGGGIGYLIAPLPLIGPGAALGIYAGTALRA